MNEITLPQGTIRYADEGKGPILLFVHGLLAAGDVWRDVVPALSSRFRCITPDWPLGSHRTAMNEDADLSPEGIAKIVAAFMKALDLRDVTLIGNDSGGAISQLVVARHDSSRRVTRLALATCDAFEVFPPKPFAYLGPVSYVPGALWFMAKALAAFPVLGRLPSAYGVATKKPIDLALVCGWLEPLARDAGIRRDLAKFVRGVSPRVTLEVAKELPRVDIPVLLPWAREDRWFPISLGERLAETFPNAELVPIDDAFVFAQLDQPAALARELDSFVRRTERQRDDVRVREQA